jgi:hypothetical protein
MLRKHIRYGQRSEKKNKNKVESPWLLGSVGEWEKFLLLPFNLYIRLIMIRVRSIYLLILLSSQIIGCENEETSNNGSILDYYIETYDFEELWNNDLKKKVEYEYNEAGKIIKYTVSKYSKTGDTYIKELDFTFSYVNDKVSSISRNNGSVVYSYQYSSDSRIQKIIETRAPVIIKYSETNFTYNDTDGSVKVVYSDKNGVSREYEFNYLNLNIVSEKSTIGSQLCSEKEYTYDRHNNPFYNFGYVHYDLSNLSANNKLTEKTNYYTICALQDLIPESYSYKYNENGYPTVIKTKYKPTNTKVTSVKKLYYRNAF